MDLKDLSRHGKLITACDISSKKLAYALNGKSDVARFTDYREMLSHLGGQIDVLSISSPDHTHAHAAQLAIKEGFISLSRLLRFILSGKVGKS